MFEKDSDEPTREELGQAYIDILVGLGGFDEFGNWIGGELTEIHKLPL